MIEVGVSAADFAFEIDFDGDCTGCCRVLTSQQDNFCA